MKKNYDSKIAEKQHKISCFIWDIENERNPGILKMLKREFKKWLEENMKDLTSEYKEYTD
jgi:hypothetical protein